MHTVVVVATSKESYMKTMTCHIFKTIQCSRFGAYLFCELKLKYSVSEFLPFSTKKCVCFFFFKEEKQFEEIKMYEPGKDRFPM